MQSDDDNLDIDWIEQEKNDLTYDFFSRCSLDNMKYTILYVNKKKELNSIVKECVSIENDVLTKEQLIGIIKKYQQNLTCKYQLISILNFSFSINHDEIDHYNQSNTFGSLLKPITYINDIQIEPCIPYFHHLNHLYFIFQEKIPSSSKQTKKILYNASHKKTKKAKL